MKPIIVYKHPQQLETHLSDLDKKGIMVFIVLWIVIIIIYAFLHRGVA